MNQVINNLAELRNDAIILLEKRKANQDVTIFKRGGFGRGKFKKYVWLDLEVANRLFRICFYTNDIDVRSGNTHELSTNVVFQRDLKRRNSKAPASPNEFNEKTQRWELYPEKTKQSKQLISCCDTAQLIEEFIQYLHKNGIKNYFFNQEQDNMLTPPPT